MTRRLAAALLTLLLRPGPMPAAPVTHDLVIYGGTSAGIIAAVQATRLGLSVVVVAPERHLGGLSSGGLGFTDIGNKQAIGGLSRDFYERVAAKYRDDAAWKFEARRPYGGQGVKAETNATAMWVFEPHVAEAVFEDYVREFRLDVRRGERLLRPGGAVREGDRLVALRTESGAEYAGRMFMDAGYEGDLLAAAGVPYTVGREARATYGETLNGVSTAHARAPQFPPGLSAYRVPGDPSSGLLPFIQPGPPGEEGSGDARVQAYCFRMCLTDHPDNRVPFAKPAGYDPDQYALLQRVLESGWREVFRKFDLIPNRKTDTNNHGPFSFDFIGMNHDYPEADYATRDRIIAAHRAYQAGWLYYLAHDPRVPDEVRTKMATWGLARDEFADNGHWPHQLYVREARRMIGAAVMTEAHCRGKAVAADSVGLAAYGMDSHNVQRYCDTNGFVRNEGDVQVGVPGPYPISYGAITPRAGACDNLLVPVCVSASHIAYGSIRMEPVFMVLGQSAATAAALALQENVPVQQVPYDKLRARLLADSQRL